VALVCLKSCFWRDSHIWLTDGFPVVKPLPAIQVLNFPRIKIHPSLFSGSGAQQAAQENLVEDPLVAGVKEIWTVDQDFDPEAFKETAQDLFFKIQAGWTRRETAVLKPFCRGSIADEYAAAF
jgi:predicted lipid-binding transport protein (Tim44 family)